MNSNKGTLRKNKWTGQNKGKDNFITGEKVWRKGKDVVCSLEKYLSMEGVRTLLKKHSKKLNNLQEENDEQSPDSQSSSQV